MSEDNPNPETGEVNLFDPALAACPQPIYGRLLEHFPVTRSAVFNSPVISRYEDVIWALRHPEIFSSEMSMELALGTHRPMIPQQIDPPAQTRFRKILDPRFSRKRMRAIEPDARQHAIDLIEAFVDQGECEFNSAMAIPLPCSVFLRFMGLPLDDLELFLDLKDRIIRPAVKSDQLEEMAGIRAAAGNQIYEYFEKMIDVRRAQPKDDVMTYLVEATLDGERLTRHEILDICYLFLIAGLDTVTATLGCNFAYLAANPEQRRKLVGNPALIPNAVEELLRWETPVSAVPRIVKQDVTLGGVDIKEGELVTLLLGAANTDDREFGDGTRVDFERERNRHLAFGGGPHRCLGSHLARMELEVAMEEFHRRIPDYEIKPGETPRYSPAIREVQYLPLVWNPSS